MLYHFSNIILYMVVKAFVFLVFIILFRKFLVKYKLEDLINSELELLVFFTIYSYIEFLSIIYFFYTLEVEPVSYSFLLLPLV